jgi:hypothetical protein
MPSSAKFHPGSRIQIEFNGFTTLRGDTMLRAKLSCLLAKRADRFRRPRDGFPTI